MDTGPEGSRVPPRSWWSRNWKWVVPLGGCLGLLASCGCLAFLVVGAGVSSLGNMEAYTDAVAIAQADDEVRLALGTPIDSGLPRQTSLSTRNGRTQARFTIPLDGPQADGVLHVDAEKDGDEWRYRTLAVELEDGSRIDLRDAVPGPPPRGLEEPDLGSEEDRALPPELPLPPEPPGMEEDGPAPREENRDIEL